MFHHEANGAGQRAALAPARHAVQRRLGAENGRLSLLPRPHHVLRLEGRRGGHDVAGVALEALVHHRRDEGLLDPVELTRNRFVAGDWLNVAESAKLGRQGGKVPLLRKIWLVSAQRLKDALLARGQLRWFG